MVYDGLDDDDEKLLKAVRKRYENLKTIKSPFIQVYDLAARYILGRRNFMTQYELLLSL